MTTETLSPAQKAWRTRRRRKAAAAKAVATRKRRGTGNGRELRELLTARFESWWEASGIPQEPSEAARAAWRAAVLLRLRVDVELQNQALRRSLENLVTAVEDGSPDDVNAALNDARAALANAAV